MDWINLTNPVEKCCGSSLKKNESGVSRILLGWDWITPSPFNRLACIALSPDDVIWIGWCRRISFHFSGGFFVGQCGPMSGPEIFSDPFHVRILWPKTYWKSTKTLSCWPKMGPDFASNQSYKKKGPKYPSDTSRTWDHLYVLRPPVLLQSFSIMNGSSCESQWWSDLNPKCYIDDVNYTKGQPNEGWRNTIK